MGSTSRTLASSATAKGVSQGFLPKYASWPEGVSGITRNISVDRESGPEPAKATYIGTPRHASRETHAARRRDDVLDARRGRAS